MHLLGLLSSLDLTDLLSNSTPGGQVPRRPAPVILKQPNTRLTPEQASELIADYQSGTRLRDLASKYDISESTVKRHIRSAGVPHRKTWALDRDQVQEASHLYATEGWSILKLSKHLGCAEDTVRRALLDNSVQMRSRGRRRSGG